MSEHMAGSGGQSSGYPLNDTVCRLISLIHKKSQSLGAYGSCEESGSAEVTELLSKMNKDDEEAVRELARKLRTELNKEFCESREGSGETDPLINCTALPLPKEEAIAKVESLKDEQLVDENESMEAVKQAAE